MKTIIALMVAFIVLGASDGYSKSKTVRKVQEVNFGDMDLKGTVRNPDGAYLVQKRGINFLPLYEVQKDMDSKIRESALYLNK